MKNELINKLNEWEQNDENEKIIQTIIKLPTKRVDFDLKLILGRAYNNMAHYDKALKVLLMDEKIGKNNALWNFLVGIAYYYQNSFEVAFSFFNCSASLGDDVSRSYSKWCLTEILNKKWYKIALNGVEILKYNKGDWSSLSLREQEVVSIYLLEMEMKNGGFISFLTNWGYSCYHNAIRGLIFLGLNNKVHIVKQQYKLIKNASKDYYLLNENEIKDILTVSDLCRIETLDENYIDSNEDVLKEVFNLYSEFFKYYDKNLLNKIENINVKILNLDLNTKH
jgi:hypothetical protein